ncbi:MAG: RecX family transcriptional regulator [Flavobacteriales bacterium]|nr:RecX family transcriptional regulator [Flavobacteriales bacterium]MEB2342038.1 regulatory protein RecX [Flavobacteriia bacterium]
MRKEAVHPGFLTKARAWCARQERSQQEVRDKLCGWKAPAKDIEAIVARLIGEGFLNEARFAEHFAVSKSRQKGWGRRKIELALKAKGVSDACIVAGLRAIDAGEEEEQLRIAVAKRWERVQETDPFARREKVIRYFLGKGFERDNVERALSTNELGR